MFNFSSSGQNHFKLLKFILVQARFNFTIALAFISSFASAQSDANKVNIDNQYETVDSLIALKNFSGAMEVLNSIGVFVEEKYGKTDTAYASVLSLKGEVYTYLKKFDSAIQVYQESLAIRRTVPAAAEGCFSILNNVGNVYRNVGLYSRAQSSIEEAIAIYRNLHGVNAPNLAIVIGNLGGVYKDLGQFEKSEQAYIEALRINEHNFGSDPMENAIVYNNLGGLYRHMGNLKLAEVYYLKLYELILKNGGSDHPKWGAALNNLAVLYSDMGNYKKSEQMQLQAIEIGISRDTSTYLANCMNIAVLYSKTKEFAKAEEYLLNVIEVQKIFLPENHREVSKSHSILGNIYSGMGNYAAAEKYLFMARDKYATTHGVVSYEYGSVLLALATIKYHTGFLPEAFQLANEGLEMVQRSIGNKHQQYGPILRKVAFIADQSGNFDLAETIYLELINYQNQLIKEQFTFMSEIEKGLYLDKVIVGYDEFYHFALIRKKENPSIVGEVYNVALNTKGILLKSSSLVRQLIIGSKDDQLLDDYDTWLSLKKKTVNLYNMPIEKRTEDPVLIEEKAQLLEKEFTKKVLGFAEMNAVMNESWVELQGDLEEDEVLIEFIDFKVNEDSTLYCALVLKPGTDFPEMIPLFEENQLLEAIRISTNNKNIESVYGTKLKRNPALYNLIWLPLEPTLVGVRKVNLSPSGLLHKISFAGLSNNDGAYLIDQLEMKFMITTASFNHDSSFDPAENSKIGLFGGIVYSSDSSSNYPWQYLSGTKAETDGLVSSFKKFKGEVNYLTGKNATKTNFVKVAPSSNILHIATHGFFFPDPLKTWESAIDSSESGEITFRGSQMSRATDVYVNSQDPLMRSGLIFAGANDYWNGNENEAEDNGIITALDVLNLSLFQTKLVVMSACESGLGDIVDGEGVYGLQRAFKMAGADFIIMSLWQVPDKETAEFMQVFYKLLFKKGDIQTAFSETQLIMRKKYDPYYWAAFVLVH
jgi:CHAT domain-containing protein/tetratricopeptide (TPR) repeat protein